VPGVTVPNVIIIMHLDSMSAFARRNGSRVIAQTRAIKATAASPLRSPPRVRAPVRRSKSICRGFRASEKMTDVQTAKPVAQVDRCAAIVSCRRLADVICATSHFRFFRFVFFLLLSSPVPPAPQFSLPSPLPPPPHAPTPPRPAATPRN